MEHFHKTYLFIPLGPDKDQILWTRHAQATSKWSFTDVVIQLLKLYLELTIYRCINDEHTPKNSDFNQKNGESYYHYKTYKNLLKFNL